MNIKKKKDEKPPKKEPKPMYWELEDSEDTMDLGESPMIGEIPLIHHHRSQHKKDHD